MNDYDALFQSVSTIAKEMQGLQTLAVIQYTPVVEAIIATRSRDVRHIEHTLDGLLDFACHPAGLQLFKALCRYYYHIDPTATVDYINAYREMCAAAPPPPAQTHGRPRRPEALSDWHPGFPRRSSRCQYSVGRQDVS